MDMSSALVLAMLIGLIPAYIAKAKGHSFFWWWVYGSVLFIFALPMSIFLKTDQEAIKELEIGKGNKRCPYCAETIRVEAVVCRFCNRNLPQSSAEQDEAYKWI
jgi:hypothetical protein